MRAIYVKTKARAEALGALLRHGADFATLARRSSLDPAAKKTGGKFLYQQGMLGSADDAAVRALPVGQISKPVRFGTSWALLVPLGPVQAPHQVPLDQVRLPIVQYLLGQKRQRKLTSWMNGVKQSCAKNARFAKGYELTS
jgi:peptidyl-prolyl cis-trans isomerase SurA